MASSSSSSSSFQNTPPQSQPSFMTRMAMRISRSRWFIFLRRVFHYQNGPRSDLGSNPFNSRTWMMLELVALLVQITSTTFTLVVSKSEKPVRPMRVWVVGYDIGCVLNLLLLCVRYYQIGLNHGAGDDALGLSHDVEQQINNEENRYFRTFFYGIVLAKYDSFSSRNLMNEIHINLNKIPQFKFAPSI